ncbi:MAG: DUF3179 domain-containing protein [Planctomycetes bacterium]|nr:DUF3179 domain-containing protein [Planctomycetia bacterium]MBI3464685.1 DUF3179 domain-containing protein [Planctomycetota bacterium]
MSGDQARRWLVVAVAIGACAAIWGIRAVGNPQSKDRQTRDATDPQPRFAPQVVVQPFPPIVDAPVIAARKVSSQVHDNELVLGVVVNGEARAYPINMLTGPMREIINDKLGGRAIAATW